MIQKSLITGVAAAAVVAAAATGTVTSVAWGGAPAITPAVWGTPLPQAPAPQLEAPLVQTLNSLAGPGSFSGKAAYIQGGLGRFETIAADRAYRNAAAKGQFPLTFALSAIDEGEGFATADVTATAATGASATQTVTFVAGPSPTGWQISKDSALALLSAV